MMGFQIVVLWSDILIWLLVAAGVGVGVLIAKNPPLLAAWRRVGANRVGMASATVLLAFIAIGLLDSLHFRMQLEGKPGQKASYAIEVLSVLDVLAAPLRLRKKRPIPSLLRRASTPRRASICRAGAWCANFRA
jgi:peptide/nickel transport system permease protein